MMLIGFTSVTIQNQYVLPFRISLVRLMSLYGPRGWYSVRNLRLGVQNNQVIYPDEAF